MLRFSRNVWGQEILLGMSWDILWLPVAAAIGVIALHQLYRMVFRRK